ncbi:MAG: hydrogenase iron-sulfur subunit [Anaerolineae bacterium]
MRKVIVFTCNWGAYTGVELAGRERLTYPAQVRLMRLPCLGRLSPGLILQAFEWGAAGVLILACPSDQCHYQLEGEGERQFFAQAEAITRLLGLDGRRLKLERIPVGDGVAFVQALTSFVEGLAGERSETSQGEA